MKNDRQTRFRVEANYACVQGTFWGSFCTLSAFTAVYLSYRGFTDTQIGLTGALLSGLSILLQAVISDYSDHHMNVPIKRIITAIFLTAIGLAGCYSLVPMPVALLILVYSATYACESCNNALLNAQLMQFNNVGIEARYGWPRGCGSMTYAVLAWVYGILAEKYTAAVLPAAFAAGTVICILFVLLMPDPYKGLDMQVMTGHMHTASYREMLTGNPTLVIFLGCVMLFGCGQTAGFTFLIRIVQRLGGGTAEFGLSEFVRAGVEMPMLFLSPLLLKKFGSKTLVVISMAFVGIRGLAVNFAPTLGTFYLACTLNMFCSGIYVFASVIMADELVRMTEKVRAQSLVALCGSLGSIAGNAYAGWMLDAVGLTPMMISAAVICFTAAALLLVFCVPGRKETRAEQ